ncbi:MAG: hypothetical protein J0M15_13000 [Deltaproteobacteria bacterium]|nr:hypothetical protein [Deltaproteobacteria bacterium]
MIKYLFYLLLSLTASNSIANPCLNLKAAGEKAGCDEHHSCYRADNDCYKGGSIAYSCENFIICKDKQRNEVSEKKETFLRKCNPKYKEIKNCNGKKPGNDCYSSKNECHIGGSIVYSCDDFVICERLAIKEKLSNDKIFKEKPDEGVK